MPDGIGASFYELVMHNGQAASADLEYILANAGFVEVVKSLGLPAWTNGCQTESKTVDEQAAAEAFISAYVPALAGADVLWDAGYLESGLACSFEMAVMVDEMIGFVRRLQRGIRVDEETMATEVISKVGPGGHFLAQKHTSRNMRKGRWFPTLLDWNSHATWQADGGKTMRERVAEKIDPDPG